MASILRKASEQGIALPNLDSFTDSFLSVLKLPEERQLIQKMGSFGRTLENAAHKLEPHLVLNYCRDIIADFHSYFTKYRNTERVISSDLPKTHARLALIWALKQTIYNALNVLGIDAPDRMYSNDSSLREDSE